MKAYKDAYGAELMAVYRGAQDTLEIIERDDHLIAASREKSFRADYANILMVLVSDHARTRATHGRTVKAMASNGRPLPPLLMKNRWGRGSFLRPLSRARRGDYWTISVSGCDTVALPVVALTVRV
jgi:hypothetical protein